MSTIAEKRQTYLNVIDRLQEMRAASSDDDLREVLARRITSEKRLLARLDEANRK